MKHAGDRKMYLSFFLRLAGKNEKRKQKQWGIFLLFSGYVIITFSCYLIYGNGESLMPRRRNTVQIRFRRKRKKNLKNKYFNRLCSGKTKETKKKIWDNFRIFSTPAGKVRRNKRRLVVNKVEKWPAETKK